MVMRKFKGKCEEKKIKKRKIKGKKIKNGFKFNELFLYASPNSFHFFIFSFFHYFIIVRLNNLKIYKILTNFILFCIFS